MVSGTVTTAINAVVMFITYPLYLHFLGYENYGLWLVLATVLTFAQLGNLGMDQAIVKLVSEEHGCNHIEGIQRYITTALAMLCISGTVALLLILVFKTRIITLFKLSDENAKMVLRLLPYIGILSIYALVIHALNAALSGLGRMDLANYIQSAGRVAAVIVAAVLLCCGRGIESLLIGNTFSYASIHIVSLLCIRRIANIQLLRIRNLDTQRGKHLLRFGGAVFGGSVISMLLSPFSKLMLSRYAGVASISVYEITFMGSMQIRGLIEAGLRALMPEVSRLSGEKTRYGQKKISQLHRDSMRLIFLFGVPLYGGLALFAPLLLRIWLRDKYVETLPAVFRIMLVGTFLTLVGVPAYYITIGFGRVCDIVKANIMGAGGNFVFVTGYYALTGCLSVYSVAWCFVLATLMPLAYLIYKTRRLIISGTNNL